MCGGPRVCGGVLQNGAQMVGAPPIDKLALNPKEKTYYEAFQTFDLDNSGYGDSPLEPPLDRDTVLRSGSSSPTVACGASRPVDIGEIQQLLYLLGRPNNEVELWNCMEAVDK